VLDWFVRKAMAKMPADRFQSAREMLEHWWNVMASLDEDGTTDVMRFVRSDADSSPDPYGSDDRTTRRAKPPVSSAKGLGSSAAPTIRKPPSAVVPATERLPDLDEVLENDTHDSDEAPTKADPNLGKLVAKELELFRKRTGRG
jgi:hypothetical protein